MLVLYLFIQISTSTNYRHRFFFQSRTCRGKTSENTEVLHSKTYKLTISGLVPANGSERESSRKFHAGMQTSDFQFYDTIFSRRFNRLYDEMALTFLTILQTGRRCSLAQNCINVDFINIF